ncbi:aldehyde dehydrogenase [Frankia sp. CNm7]|uniref:aldehyde dehydrogenase (NAD(+)) n=1 Tax=Frankia nepalensis TaxID=1836974 RepID=A0A937UN74_9ACTN|nr:aldehyde dehydrogenase [Frankia nepalensis]MBL7502822.1 aldehyde dehydrogenase [Frankia nepalensis]MBL7515102.1 aldehyde dehydrogenase [Frankia nepalensis]MBL7518829.1 aldehyde dehydrogenase [Frankia nepalensis]MBL7625950.1 aldehyde dehydrogenase [Frankia nepalensis]
MQVHDRLFIGGTWAAPAGSGTIDVISPHSEEVVGRVPEGTTADLDAAVAAAREAFDHGPWPRLSPAERADAIGRVAAVLNRRAEEVANTVSTEMGCPVSWALFGQVYAATFALDYFASLARAYTFSEVRAGMMGPALVRRLPVGVVGAIVPWNVPLYVTALKLGPALASGSTIVIKPAPETPLSAWLLAEAVEEAGLPPGVVSIVPAHREVAEHLVRHPGVDKISFTGSTAAGRRIASLCGERLARCTLELGGKSAALLLPDVDIEAALPALLPASLMNNGQACVAQTRWLAPRERYDEIVEALVAKVAAMKVGDPLDPATEVGPLVAARQRDRVEGYIAAGREAGAKVALGGGRPAELERGFYVEPTVFTEVDNAMRIAQEEIFGPVLSVIPYSGVEEAVAIANDSRYGLSGSVWTADLDAGLDISARIRTGTFNVNTFMLENSAPFGGFKESGLGRELGPEGLSAYLEYQTVNLPAGWTPPAAGGAEAQEAGQGAEAQEAGQ